MLVCTKVSLFVVVNRPLPVYISSPFANFCGICTHFSLIFDLSLFSLVSRVTVELLMFVLTIFIDHKSHCLPSAVVCTYTNTHTFTCSLVACSRAVLPKFHTFFVHRCPQCLSSTFQTFLCKSIAPLRKRVFKSLSSKDCSSRRSSAHAFDCRIFCFVWL